jgi:hypothetical protein
LSAILGVLLVLFVVGCSNKPRFEHYGHFVQSSGDPVELKGFQFEGMHDHFQGSDVNNTLSVSRDPSGLVRIWVYQAAKTGTYVLLTDLKSSGGEYVCCFNFGSYERNPRDVCRPVDFVEQRQESAELRLFEATLESGVYCFMNNDTRHGYIFDLK